MPKEYTAVNIPMDLIGRVDSIVEKGLYSSRSEFVKDSIRRLILYYEASNGIKDNSEFLSELRKLAKEEIESLLTKQE